MSARKYTLDELWNIAIRNRWLILIPVAVGLAAAPLLSRFAPLRYRSEALILVVPPQVPENYVQPSVTESVEDRLPGITAQILSRSKLERIIVEMDLYKNERKREVMEDIVERMRLRDVTTAPTGRDIDSFRVAYLSDDPRVAQEVTRRLSDLYIDQNTADRQSQAQSTSALLASAIQDAEKRLKELDQKLAAYRQAHPGQMPAQLQPNMQSIASLNVMLAGAHSEINRADENRLRVEREIANLDAVPLPTAPVAPPPAGQPPTIAEQLDAARAQLEQARQRYLEGHPAIGEAERAVAELTSKLENDAPLSARTTALEKPITQGEAARKQRLLQLQSELETAGLRLNQQRANAAGIRRQIADYEAKVAAMPARESELADLMREYNTLNESYSELLLKRESASLAAGMERRQIGEQFKVLDPASRPERPFNQLQRFGVLSSGAAAGLVLAILVLGLREYRDSSFRSKDEVMQILSLPVLASIPVMSSAREREMATRRRWAMDIGGSAMLMAAVAVVVAWRFYS